MQNCLVAKIGGVPLENKKQLGLFIRNFVNWPGLKVFVHGGGVQANQLMDWFGLQPKKVNGLRITDHAALGMIIAGFSKLNSDIVDMLNDANEGNDGHYVGFPKAVISSYKMRPVVVDGKEVDYGFVGDTDKNHVQHSVVEMLEAGEIPVFSPLTWNGASLMNTNADVAAAAIAAYLSNFYNVEIAFVSDVPGVYNAAKAILTGMNRAFYSNLKSLGVISGGMIPKVDYAYQALDGGVQKARITDCLLKPGTEILR